MGGVEAYMRKHNVPMTWKNWLALQYGGHEPEEWTEDDEELLPPELRDR